MSNLINEINRTARQVSEIMESGYSRAEAIELVKAAALSRLAECTRDCNGKSYVNIIGEVATYEQ